MSIASHELRTPLTALRGYLEMLQLQLDKDDERSRRRLEIALAMVHRLVRMVDDLLDVGRLHSGKFVLAQEETNVNDMLQEAVTLGRAMGNERSIELELPDDPVFALIDPMRVQQVVLNLLNNALTYSPDTTPVLVRMSTTASGLVLEVEDYGEGIPERVQDKIFNRFFQSELLEEQSRRGLGLGLFITREIVHAHGGTIEVRSVPGEGPTFTVRLPRCRDDSGAGQTS